jgi:flagellar motor switch protein FliG
MVLSKLSPAAAAKVLLTLENPQRNVIIARMVTLTNVPETATRIVENQLRTHVLAETSSKDNAAGQARVASMLNEMDKSELEEVMRDMESSGIPDLAAIKARLFAFEDVLLLDQKARVALFDGLSSELVTVALRGAEPQVVEAALSSIGARSRRMIESELGQGSQNVQQKDILQARKEIAATAIRMAREGAFDLPATQPAEAA